MKNLLTSGRGNLVFPKALPIMFLCLVGGQAFASTPSGSERIQLE